VLNLRWTADVARWTAVLSNLRDRSCRQWYWPGIDAADQNGIW